jgi:hypothetical protein
MIRDVDLLSRIRFFFIPDPGGKTRCAVSWIRNTDVSCVQYSLPGTEPDTHSEVYTGKQDSAPYLYA